MKVSINPIFYFIAGVIFWVLIISQCNRCGSDKIIQTKSDTIIRVTYTMDTFTKIINQIIHDSIRVEIPVYVDTQKTIEDYYTFKSVQDSFIGKNYKVLLNDTLYMNSLYARKAMISVRQVDSIITNTITLSEKPKVGILAGLTYSTNQKFEKNYLYLNGGIQTKKGHVIVIGADLMNGQYQGTYLYKLKIK